MNFELTEDKQALRDAFARFLNEKSSIEKVRAALDTGFDPDLWSELAALGAFSVRVRNECDGLGLGLVDAAALMEEAGRTLASGPVCEAIVAAALLADCEGSEVSDLLGGALDGSKIVTFALHDISEVPVQWIAGGEIADAILAIHGPRLVIVTDYEASGAGRLNLGQSCASRVIFPGEHHSVLAEGEKARIAHARAVEEWKLLKAAELNAMGREAIRLAAEYACERIQFGQPIGAYQAVSHPLADLITEVEAGKLLTWQAIRAIADGAEDAAAQISLALWWNAGVAARAGQQGVQTFGGYGLTTEYDIHLYNLRAKAAPLLLGDAERLLEEAGERLYCKPVVVLPQPGEVPIEFDFGEEARVYAAEVDAFFKANLTPELKAKAHFSWEGHDPGLHKKLGDAGLLFPSWPAEDGGRGLGPYAVAAGTAVWVDHGWSTYAAGVTGMIGTMVRKFGTDELKSEVLTRIVNGEAICSLGWSEPASGSDVFAAQCRATRDGDGWRIDGTKMFTSGANLADYVLMLARTDLDAPKHKGLTMFIVPLNADGVTIQPVYTFMDERTNITFYDGVRIPDSWRLGDVNGGARVMGAALEMEHGGSFWRDQANMVAAAEAFCRAEIGNGRPLIDDPAVRARLARSKANMWAGRLLGWRATWASVNAKSNASYGPMAKLFSSERFLSDASDLVNLAAPHALSCDETPAGKLNLAYRHAHGTRIYGGTSQVHRSLIAEGFLGLPRTRAAG